MFHLLCLKVKPDAFTFLFRPLHGRVMDCPKSFLPMISPKDGEWTYASSSNARNNRNHVKTALFSEYLTVSHRYAMKFSAESSGPP